MKKLKFKHFISLFLAVMMLVLTSAPIFAAELITERCPNIHVPGIMSSEIYVDASDPDSEITWPPSTDSILGLVKDCIPALLEFSVTRNWDKLGDDISPLAYEFFKNSCSDPDGSITNGSGIIFDYPTPEELKNDPDTIFHYDWRADPFESAAKLNDYINYVLECTGAQKVAIDCHSLGGIITLTYLSVYGFDKIDALAFNTTAIYGESYTGHLFMGDIVISNDSLMSFLDFAVDGIDNEELLDKIFDLLEAAGLGSLVASLGNTILENLGDKLIPEVVVPLFGKWLTIWAMVPDEDIDEAMEYTFTNFIPEGAEGKEELRSKIEKYNTLVRDKKDELLLKADRNGNFGVISRYGYSSIPATSQWQQISDGVLDSKNSSFGATFALYGATLDDGIINNTPPEFISPDKTVDASTCLFPEKTWFIKYAKHSDNYDDLDHLVDCILYSEEEITVYSLKEFPRFLIYNSDINRIIPDTEEILNENNGIFSFLQKIKEFFAVILKKLRALFNVL
ncbi:MAG: alpha/beta hydrolase [Ruminococcaceae bacterium]|nr:alpha/beta hydrolase [Oscillospiraceae bacterium]